MRRRREVRRLEEGVEKKKKKKGVVSGMGDRKLINPKGEEGEKMIERGEGGGGRERERPWSRVGGQSKVVIVRK